MKPLPWLLILVAGGGVWLAAQPNPPSAKPGRGETDIMSDMLEFDYPTRTTIYRRNVRVDDPQLKLTCELLTARFMTNSPKFQVESIVAETNVVIDAIDWEGRTNHAVAEKLVYAYSVVGSVTNQTLELTGNPRLTNYAFSGGLTGEVIFVDLVLGKVYAQNQRTTFKSEASKDLTEELGGKKSQLTNQPPATLPK